MKKSLVIVESPSKAKTINKFLGKDFIVTASVGHIRDLPEKELGVDVENGFKPKYVAIARQKKVIGDLKSLAKKSENVYIATDPDREGEAIAWHIAHEIGKINTNIYRALFNEITEKAVTKAIEDPLEIDSKKVDAQQARRVLDRLVGYKVSPILWKTIYKGPLSAGRVQSVALRLICEREKEFQAFKPEEYWSIKVLLNTPNENTLLAKLSKIDSKKVEIPNEASSKEIIAGFKNNPFIIDSIKKKQVKRNPLPPFITSTMQQESANKIGFPPTKTMMIAQQLYEGVELGSEGSISLITYMRTDSTRISNEALGSLKDYILKEFGNEYLPDKTRIFKGKKKAKVQDAHECIRPTYFNRPPSSVNNYLSGDQLKLYTLIWNRSVASQMENAVFNQTSIDINAGKYQFRASGSEQVFAGFLKLWEEIKDNNNGEDDIVSIPPGLQEKMELILNNIDPAQHFTKPPPRFNDSSLVKELEQLGIGRPSTYAQIIFTLVQRKYVIREKRTIIPTELGEVVSKIVVKLFPDLFNVDFTAKMEEELDQIEAGSKNYLKVVEDFYIPFSDSLDKAVGETKAIKESIQEKTGEKCPECGNELLIKWSKSGKFYACSAFPECKHTHPLDKVEKPKDEPTGQKCEKCGKDMVEKTGRYGKFIACSGYPECKNILKKNGNKSEPPEKAGFKCEKCGKDMIIRTGRRGKFYACSGFPKCRNTKPIKNDKESDTKE